jgi:hypothetical protein
MEWDLSFLGWKHQVCLINWPTSMSVKKLQPCVGFKLDADTLRTIILLLKKRHLPQPEPKPECDDEEDKEENEEWMAWVCACEEDEKGADLAPQIESWTESKKWSMYLTGATNDSSCLYQVRKSGLWKNKASSRS